MAFEETLGEVDPVLLARVTNSLVGRLRDPEARKDSFNAGEWWLAHPAMMHILDAIIPKISDREGFNEEQKSAAYEATLFTLRVIGEYTDFVADRATLPPID